LCQTLGATTPKALAPVAILRVAERTALPGI